MAFFTENLLEDLRSSVTGDVVCLPQDSQSNPQDFKSKSNPEGYDTRKCIVFPQSTEDLSCLVKFAVNRGIQVVPLAVGDNLPPARNPAISVDLSKHIKHTTVESDKKVAYVGAGAIWKDVEEAAEKFGLAIVSSTDNTLQVGRFISGGIISAGWLSGEYGLATHNILQATIVTIPSGEIITVSETNHADIFHVIQGGVNEPQYILTELAFQLHPITCKTALSGMLIFLPRNFESMVKAIGAWSENPTSKEGGRLIFTRCPQNEPAFVFTAFYLGPKEEGLVRFNGLYEIAVRQFSNEVPFKDINATNNSATPSSYSAQLGPFSPKLLTVARAAEISTKHTQLTNPSFIQNQLSASIKDLNGTITVNFFPGIKGNTNLGAPYCIASLRWFWAWHEASTVEAGNEWMKHELKLLESLFTGN